MINLATADSGREAAKTTSALPVTYALSQREAAQLQRKIDLRVLPMLFIVSVMAFLDR